MDRLGMGALAVDAARRGRRRRTARRASTSASHGDPRGSARSTSVLGEHGARASCARRASCGGERPVALEESSSASRGASLRLRVAVHTLRTAAGDPFGRVCCCARSPTSRCGGASRRSSSGSWSPCPARSERGSSRRAGPRCAARRAGAGSRGVASPGMGELAERISRTVTALENWLAVDDALAREDFPDAQLLLRSACASRMSRWPLPDEIPARVRELARARGGLLRVRREPEAARPLTARMDAAPPGAAGLDRLVLRVDRLRPRAYAFTYAFHARELRFERRSRRGLAPRLSRDVLVPRRSPRSGRALPPARGSLDAAAAALSSATRRDAEGWSRRLRGGLPGYLERVLDRLEMQRAPEAGHAGRVHAGRRRCSRWWFARFVRGQAARRRASRSGWPASICASSLWRVAVGSGPRARGARRARRAIAAAARAGRAARGGVGGQLLAALAGSDVERRRAARCCCSPSAPSTAGSRTSASTRATGRSRARTRRSADRETEVLAVAARPAPTACVRGRGPLAVPAPPAQQGLPAAAREGEALLPAPVRRRALLALIQHVAFLAEGRGRARARSSRATRHGTTLALSLLSPARSSAPPWPTSARRCSSTSPPPPRWSFVTAVVFWYLIVQFVWRGISPSSSPACHASGPASSSAICRSS